MSGLNLQPVVIAAGGTGGHFFPAEALADILLKRGARVVLMTDARSGALNSTVFAGVESYVLAGAGLSGRSPLRALQGILALLRGIMQARKILLKLQPGVVVGFGGYPAVPPILAARIIKRRPVNILHEQNAVLGRANRLLAHFSDTVAVSFAKTKNLPKFAHIIVSGNPVRAAIAALHGKGYRPADEKIRILVLGGSLGAKIFGTLIPAALALLPAYLRARLVVSQQCRAQEHDAAQAVYGEAGIAASLSPFFWDVASQIAASHLVIARAGASTVAELAVAGRPAIFIPLPNAIDDHQRANADALADMGGGWRFDQSLLTPQILANKIEALLGQPKLLAKAAEISASFGRPDAAADLAGLVANAMAGAVL